MAKYTAKITHHVTSKRLNRGKNGSSNAAIAYVIVMTVIIRTDISVCATWCQMFKGTGLHQTIPAAKQKHNYVLFFRIVTGVGLIKVNGIIQFLIIEKQLIKYGQLNDTRTDDIPWTLGEQFSIDHRSAKSGTDYHALTWDHRRINLDTVIAPLGRVVTGVRFGLVNEVLSIEIRANDFDFLTGKVEANGTWICSNITERKMLRLQRPDVSTSTPIKSIRNNEPNLLAEFMPTDIVKDAAQHTVPFFDNLVSEPKHSVPLSGIGLYHKTQPGYGGFIAPQVVVYNFEPYISPPDEF